MTKLELFFGAKLHVERYPFIHDYDKIIFPSGQTLKVADFIGTRISKDSHILTAQVAHYYNTRLDIAATVYNDTCGYLPFILAKQKQLCLNVNVHVHSSTIPPFETYTLASISKVDALALFAELGIKASEKETSSRDKYD